MFEGGYVTSDKLWHDIKRDFALLLGCVRKVHDLQARGPKNQLDPFNALRSAMVEDFEKILPKSEKTASAHVFEALTVQQARRLEQAVIAANTAEVLAETARCDPARLYFVSAMRQLGAILVAWNYPRVFDKAREVQRTNGGDLETLLSAILGYSPRALSIQIGTHWGLEPEVLQLIGADGTQRHGLRRAELDQERQFCEIGETFAWALAEGDSDLAREKLDWVKTQLQAMLGSAGMRMIRERVNAHMADFVSVLPERFDAGLLDEKGVVKEMPPQNKVMMSRNIHIAQCIRPVQDSFERVYRHMLENRASPPSIRLLITELIPAAGFHHGCIYLPDSDVGSLVPKITIGTRSKEEFQPSAQVGSGAGLTTPVSRAFMGTSLVAGKAPNELKQTIIYLAQAIGVGHKRGVLYLESDQEKFVDGSADPIPYFNSIHRGLCDALNIKAPTGGADRADSTALFIR